MSKRYGRNQKRRHLLEIQRLLIEAKQVRREHEHAYQSAVSELKMKLREQQDILIKTISMIENICPLSAALPPKFEEGPKTDRYRVAIHRPGTLTPFTNNVLRRTQDMIVVDTYALQSHISDNMDKFSKNVHLRYGFGHEVVYRLSRETLSTMPADIIASYLIPDLTKKLISKLKEQMG